MSDAGLPSSMPNRDARRFSLRFLFGLCTIFACVLGLMRWFGPQAVAEGALIGGLIGSLAAFSLIAFRCPAGAFATHNKYWTGGFLAGCAVGAVAGPLLEPWGAVIGSALIVGLVVLSIISAAVGAIRRY